jgi:purine-nucleoside phosphorylase
MDDLHQPWLEDAKQRVRTSTQLVPRVGIILGSGLGGFAAQVIADMTVPYSAIPGFPVSTAIGHKGQLTLGHFVGHPVAVLEGRFHLYEGYSADQVVRPVHLLKALGVEILLATNAAGGLNPDYRVGDVVVVEDHVNMMWAKPRLGGAESSPGQFYDRDLVTRALAASRAAGVIPQSGVYVGMTGPNYETRAEYRWLRQIGDLVGMSTIPEVITARSLGMQVLALSVVSNACNPDWLEPTDGAHVVAAVARAEGRIREIVRGVLDRGE